MSPLSIPTIYSNQIALYTTIINFYNVSSKSPFTKYSKLFCYYESIVNLVEISLFRT